MFSMVLGGLSRLESGTRWCHKSFPEILNDTAIFVDQRSTQFIRTALQPKEKHSNRVARGMGRYLLNYLEVTSELCSVLVVCWLSIL